METKIAGTAKIIAKKSAIPDFLLCSAGPAPSSTNTAPYPELLIFLIKSAVFTSPGAKT